MVKRQTRDGGLSRCLRGLRRPAVNQPEEYTVTNMPDQVSRDVVVIGGCGHVGLPLAIAFADRGAKVGIYDVSEAAVATVNSGQMPFAQPGADEALSRVLAAGRLVGSADPAIVATAEHVIVVIGTPVDEHLNPKQIAITKALGGCSEFLRDGQLLVLRSTVFPGVTALVEKMMGKLGRKIEVAFCPERIAEGKAMTELFELPQIVSARTPAGAKRASALFGRLTGQIVVMTPEEAELAKLFTNVWRYIKFATANHGSGELDVAPHVGEQLGQLRLFRRHHHDLAGEPGEQRGRPLHPRGRAGGDDLRQLEQLGHRLALGDPLRAEGNLYLP